MNQNENGYSAATEWRKCARFPKYEVSATGEVRYSSMSRIIKSFTITDSQTGEKVKKVMLLSNHGYNVEAFVTELHRAAWPEAYTQQPTKIHVPGLSGLPGRLAA